LRRDYERKTGRQTTIRNKSFAIELNDGIARLVGKTPNVSERQEVERVSIRGEEARIGRRGIVNR
jgi:hypothetical protein